jgi:proline iminopeptidase
VIQAPGWGIGSTYLRSGLLPLESHFTLLYIEPRGSNNSIRPEKEEMSTSIMVEDLERLREVLRLEKLSILGHSHGGIVSLGYACRYPERVEKLVLVVHALQGYDDSGEWNRFAEERKHDPRYKEAYSQRATAEIHDPKSDEEYTERFFKRIAYCFSDPVKYQDSFLKTVSNKLSLWTWNAVGAADKEVKWEQKDELVNVKAETLIVGAVDDPLGTVNVANITHEGIKGSKMVILSDCGHFPWIEQSSKFFDAIRTFLGKDLL